jgi:hypothetical protein
VNQMTNAGNDHMGNSYSSSFEIGKKIEPQNSLSLLNTTTLPDFRTPAVARNSSEKRPVSFRARKCREWILASLRQATECDPPQRPTRRSGRSRNRMFSAVDWRCLASLPVILRYWLARWRRTLHLSPATASIFGEQTLKWIVS